MGTPMRFRTWTQPNSRQSTVLNRFRSRAGIRAARAALVVEVEDLTVWNRVATRPQLATLTCVENPLPQVTNVACGRFERCRGDTFCAL